MSGEGSREVRYTAFLSYSHQDAAAAGRLHRRLENFRMPRRLVGGEGARGPIPDRLWPIFRDREELPAATDLSETVRAALAQSGALIILCSPAAAASLWVAEEIETFRRLHPDRPILAAVLDGDPPDCFPAALRAFGRDGTWHEPLATDLRPHRDGGRLGLLKLVAGITGVGLDALVQRDAARRVRRVMAVTMGAVAMMIVMAALAVVALRARGEAERQRVEAEGMADFMLTDLRNKLREVGRLDIMRAVNERALAHYESQIGHGDRTSQTLLQRARALQAIGEDDVTHGDYPRALALFLDARRTTAEQLARSPNDAERLSAHAQSEYWVGSIYEARRDWPAAARQYERYTDAADRLIAAAPHNPDYMMTVASSAVDLGNVQLNGTGEYAAAQRSYEKAVLWFGRAARARPSDPNAPRNQANAYGWLADSFFYRRMWRQSLAARLRQYQLVEPPYRADPANVDASYRFALAERGVGDSFAQLGMWPQARPYLFDAYAASVRLNRLDPQNAVWLALKAFVSCDLYYYAGDLPAGVARAQLRNDVRAAWTHLAAAHNPHASEVYHCLSAMGPGAAPQTATGD